MRKTGDVVPTGKPVEYKDLKKEEKTEKKKDK